MSRTWKTEPFSLRAARVSAPIHAVEVEDQGHTPSYDTMPMLTGREAREVWRRVYYDENIHYDTAVALSTIPSLRCSCPLCRGEYYYGDINRRSRRARRLEDSALLRMVNSPDYDPEEF